MSKKKEGKDYFILRTSREDQREKLEEILKMVPIITVDIGEKYLDGKKEILSEKFVWDNMEYWRARDGHSVSETCNGDYWTTNFRDPKILNVLNDRCRGNIQWGIEGGNPAGKPKGAAKRISAKAACEKLGVNPADLIAGIMAKDRHTLKKYGIHDIKNITVAMQLKTAFYLMDKQVPSLKLAELGTDGEPVISEDISKLEKRSQIQAYIPTYSQDQKVLNISKEDYESIESEGGVNDYLKNHEDELNPYDKSNENEAMVWEVNSEDE